MNDNHWMSKLRLTLMFLVGTVGFFLLVPYWMLTSEKRKTKSRR